MNNEEIKRRFDSLHAQRQVIQETWSAIERYIAPYRGRFFKDERSENSIEWRRPYVYDSTAVMAAQSLAAHLHSSLTSPKIKWFDLRFRLDTLNEDHDAVVWLDEVSEIVFKALQDSNFTVQAGETYQDLVDFGTSIITEEVESEIEWKGIDFNSIPVKEGYFEQDAKGNLVNFYRRLEWTSIQMCEKFGEENLPKVVADNLEEGGQVNKKWIVIFCVYQRKEYKDANVMKTLAPDKRPYGYKYILHDSVEEVGKPGGYYEMPAFCPRWRTTSSSMWGNSPAMIALSDVMTLNRMIELMIQAAEKAIDPVMLTTARGLMGDLNLNPGALNVVKDLEQLKPLQNGARFDITYKELERYRNQIREYFLIDQLQLPPMEGTPATATEIAARLSQLERLIGPTLGRLQKDFLDPTITRTFNILLRADRLPAIPDTVREAGGGLDVEYIGALARTQQQDRVDALDGWVMNIANLAQVNPDVMDIPDWDVIVREGGHLRGVPAKFMKDQKKVLADRKQREKQQQEMMQAQAAEQEGKAMEAQGKGQAALSGVP